MLIEEKKLYDLKNAYQQILNENVLTEENNVEELIGKDVAVSTMNPYFFIRGILEKTEGKHPHDLAITVIGRDKNELAQCAFNYKDVKQISKHKDTTLIQLK